MSKESLDILLKIVQIIFFSVMILITLYGQVSSYLNDFWKGFLLGALSIFLLMLVVNIFFRKWEKVKPPPPSLRPPIAEHIEEPEDTTTVVAGTDELLPLLRDFMNYWEQYERLSEQEKSQSTHRLQGNARVTSSLLLGIDSRCADSWDQELRRQVQITSDKLHKFGISDVGATEDYKSAEAKGKDAYDKVSALASLLRTYTKD